jgi:hypothetical protein
MDAIRCTRWELAVWSTVVVTNRTGELWQVQNLHRFQNLIASQADRLQVFFAPFTGKHLEADLPDHPTVVSPQ